MNKVQTIKNMAINHGIVKIKLANGRYFAVKTNDDYTVLRKDGDSWKKVEDNEIVSKTDTIVYLNDVLDEKAKKIRCIAVNDEFANWELGIGFSFTVKDGKATLSMTTFSKEQMKAQIAEVVN